MADAIQTSSNPSDYDRNLALPTSVSPPRTTVIGEPAGTVVSINPGDGFPEFSIPPTAYWLAGFREWALSDNYPERGQITFSPDELIIDLSPELFETHNFIKVEIGFVLYGLIRPQRLGDFFADRALYTNVSANVSTEPDSIFVSNESLESGRCQLLESARAGINKELVGSPDWILEVVSPTSVKKDKELLPAAYFRAGIGEYWLVDALGDDIDFQILVPGKESFVAVEPSGGWLASPTFNRSFRLTREKNKFGSWRYTLQMK
jgi:Uma2 family endonuclease